MENNVDIETAQLAYEEVKQELLHKVGTFGLCMAAFFVLIKLVSGDQPFFDILEAAFTFALAMYLPFKICYQASGSVLGGFIGSLILVVIIGLVLDSNSFLLSLVLLGGLALDFSVSISKLLKIKKLLTPDSQ